MSAWPETKIYLEQELGLEQVYPAVRKCLDKFEAYRLAETTKMDRDLAAYVQNLKGWELPVAIFRCKTLAELEKVSRNDYESLVRGVLAGYAYYDYTTEEKMRRDLYMTELTGVFRMKFYVGLPGSKVGSFTYTLD